MNTTDEYVNARLSRGWELDTKDMYGGTSSGMGLGNVAPTMATQFPREWVKPWRRRGTMTASRGSTRRCR